MRKLLKVLLSLVFILILVAVALPFLIPVESYKQEIAAQVKKATGRDLVIAGGMRASVFPALGVDIENASLSNPAGFSDTPMLAIGKLSVEVELWPLFSKQIQVKRFVLEKPVIRLEVSANGKPNWEFSSGDAPQASAASENTDGVKAEALLAGLVVGDVNISHGEVSYHDARSKKTIALSDVNLKTAFSGFSSPLRAEGNAVWNQEKVAVTLSLAQPDVFATGNASGLTLGVQSTPVTLQFDGKATMLSATGPVKLSIPSLPKLAKWTGGGFEWKGEAPLAFSVQGDMECAIAACAIKNSEISLDAIKAKGNLKASFAGKPTVEATLATEMLDLNPYLPKKQATNWFVSDALAMEPWSAERIDLSGLNAANAVVSLNTGGLLYDKIKMGKTSLSLNLAGGMLKTSIPKAEFYGGTISANASLGADGAFTKQFTISGVQAEPFLRDAMGDDRFSGTMNMSGTINGRLTSIRDMVSTLGGNGSINLADGAVKGVDIAGMIRNVQSAFKQVDTAQKKTDFSEMGGTFTIANGIISNNDLMMKAPLLRISGKGTVNLPLQIIQYRLTPEIVQTAQGQGGKEKQGIAVPIIIDGPLDQPNYRPDLAGLAQKALENPEAIKETVKDIQTQIKENKGAIKDLLKGLKGR